MDIKPNVVEEVARVAREAVREAVVEEMREEMRRELAARKRPARLYAGAGAAGLYGGAAVVAAVVLGLGAVVPMWASALIVGAGLLIGAMVLRGMARPRVRGAGTGQGASVARGVRPGERDGLAGMAGVPPVPEAKPKV
ncbi:phage holin family protein [Streptomyces sp. NBC_00237]|uniref:phage holin family protein n=1 Tax=Streptomyces sp. NBC_00237 TaxID=2975687 RepID=UPI002251FB91|nr:phage holin family protein [Streptomyces sp. NBC_00237]MCX5203067.1 phage holin family protein [Streptomyces sp. NBC_00237]